MLLLGARPDPDAWLVDNDGDVEMVSPTEESVRLNEALLVGAATSSTPEGSPADQETPDSSGGEGSLLTKEGQEGEDLVKGEKPKNTKRPIPMIPPRSYRGLRCKFLVVIVPSSILPCQESTNSSLTTEKHEWDRYD